MNWKGEGKMKEKMLIAVVMFCLVVGGAQAAYPYLVWDSSMNSAQSSDLGGYPAQEVFDSTFGALGWRADWNYVTGSAQGDAGFQLRDDGHGMWHSTASGSYTSPAGVACQEWLAADFGSVKTIYGADIWNLNTFYHARGVKDMSFSVSTDGSTWTTVWAGEVAEADGTLPDLIYDAVTYLHPTDPSVVQYGRLYDTRADFGGEVIAQYVVLNIFSQWDASAYGDYIGLEECRFLVVPEPAALGLMGFGILGLLRRKR